MLEQLVASVAPDGVDTDLWVRWLEGGESPFEKHSLRKISGGDERQIQTLMRAPPRVSKQEQKLEQLRRDQGKLEAKIAQEERLLRYFRSHQNAALHWFVVEQLIKLMSPLFAMGPAWTLMRALSAHISDEHIDRRTPGMFGAEKEEVTKRLRANRVKETEKLMAALDHFSGFEPFEDAVRKAIAKVVSDFERRAGEAAKDGRRPRSAKARAENPHPKAQKDASAVLEGLNVRA